VTALEVPCLIHLGHWRNALVEPVGLEPTLGFLPLIKSQVSAIQFEYDSKLGGSPGSRIPSERLRAAYAAVNTCDPLVDVVRVELTDWRL
jgi:hypothetical protein